MFFKFQLDLRISSENAWNSPNSNYLIGIVINSFTNHQQLYHSSFLSLDFLVKPELMGFREILLLCLRVHSSEISFKHDGNFGSRYPCDVSFYTFNSRSHLLSSVLVGFSSRDLNDPLGLQVACMKLIHFGGKLFVILT